MKNLNEKLTSVEIWDANLNDWQNYDCPDNGDTVIGYAEWCIGEHSDYWATINSAADKIRLNGWYVVDGAEHYNEDN